MALGIWFTRCSLGCLSWSELFAERYPKSTYSYVQKLVPVRCLNRTLKNHLRWIKFGGRSDRGTGHTEAGTKVCSEGRESTYRVEETSL